MHKTWQTMRPDVSADQRMTRIVCGARHSENTGRRHGFEHAWRRYAGFTPAHATVRWNCMAVESNLHGVEKTFSDLIRK